MTQENDPVKQDNDKALDEEFQRILNEKEWRQKEIEKVRNLTRWP